MEYFNNILCFAAGWLIENDILTKDAYRNMARRDKLQIVRRACRNTPALISYDSMPDALKETIQTIIKGDPYTKVKYSVLEGLIVANTEASVFFESFRLPNGRFIPKKTRLTYYNNAIILDAIHTLIISKQAKRRAMGGKTTRSWDKISEAVQSLDPVRYPHDLPTNARSLERKYKAYKSKDENGGFVSLIHQNYLKEVTNNTKINDSYKASVLSELLGDPRNLDNAQVAANFNEIAKKLGWQEISTQTAGVWRKKLDLIDFAGRRGTGELYNSKLMQVKRSAPTNPLYYWTLDGWDVELMYKSVQVQKYKDKKTGMTKERNVTTYWNRLTVVVVLDPFNKYPVGYAIGTHETPELIKAALRNAAQHTAELFGNMYRTHQIQSDKYAKDAMRPIYDAMGAHYTMTSKKFSNAKAKIIEPYFKYLNKTYCQSQINWSGFGITAKKDKQPNSEFLNKYHNNFPDKNGCAQQIARFIEHERNIKRDAYLEAWAKMPAADKIKLSYESYLRTFGERTGHKNYLHGSGVHATINGIKRSYDCFDLNFRKHAATQWSILFDPDNTSRVLAINDDETLRFVLEEKYLQPMALHDRKEGDAAALARIGAFNEGAIAYITEQRAITGDKVRELFDGNPQLNETAAKLMLVDSMGRNKIYKQPRELPAQPADEKPRTKSIYEKY
ncbi:hypothetical protein [Dysgonomonas sp. ZJ279]|uniref:hypothetical protein n=1 Tax=Dysgonomonas sp. ZJ279 TaxID=2709796 RepID=UPI0013ECA2E0|nr:hypothetical protein [Dysgonomonas sp. ZJ279]